MSSLPFHSPKHLPVTAPPPDYSNLPSDFSNLLDAPMDDAPVDNANLTELLLLFKLKLLLAVNTLMFWCLVLFAYYASLTSKADRDSHCVNYVYVTRMADALGASALTAGLAFILGLITRGFLASLAETFGHFWIYSFVK